MVAEQRSVTFVTLVRYSSIIVKIFAKTCTLYYLNNVSFLVQPRYRKLSGIWDMSSLKKDSNDMPFLLYTKIDIETTVINVNTIIGKMLWATFYDNLIG